MYLTTYDFEILYRKGTANPANAPSRRPDYVDGPANVTWLPTFQNKLKGSFAVAMRRFIKELVKSPPKRDQLVLAIHAIAKGKGIRSIEREFHTLKE